MNTFSILSEENNISDKGFEIQSPNKDFVHWDIAQKDFYSKYQDLLKNVEAKGMKIQFPVRIGKLVFHDLFISDNFSRNSYKPFSSFYTQCSGMDSKAVLADLIRLFESQGGIAKDSYYGKETNDFVVRPIHTKPLTTPSIIYAEEELDMVEIVLQWGGLEIVLSRETDQGKDLVNVVFWNSKSISDFFRKHYAEHLQLAQHIILNEKRLSLASGAYFDVDAYFHKIEFELNNSVMIWRDNVNACIGFIDQNQVHIFDLNEISFFSITNIDDGRIGFYSELKVHFSIKNREPMCLLSYSGSPGKVHFFDDKMGILKNIAKKEIIHKGYLT